MEKLATRNSAPPNLALALVNLLSGTVDKSARTVQSGATAVEESQLICQEEYGGAYRHPCNAKVHHRRDRLQVEHHRCASRRA
jgi:hypothetical protein